MWPGAATSFFQLWDQLFYDNLGDGMARINVEDELFKDNRFTNLCIALGSRRNALGSLVEAWVFAQTYVSPENPTGHCPKADWDRQGFAEEIFTVGLARIEDGHVYLSGAEEQFSWLVSRQNNGRKGGRPKAETEETDNNHPVTETNLVGTGGKPLTLSLPLSLSLTQTPTLSVEEVATKVAPPAEVSLPKVSKKKPDVRRFIATYIDAYRARYKADPVVDGKNVGIARRIVESLGDERSCQAAQVYLQMPDKWFETKCHDLASFEQNLNPITKALQTGLTSEQSSEQSFWDEVWRDDESRKVPGTNSAPKTDLRRQTIPSGTGETNLHRAKELNR
jgi:hypothetical protein